MANTEVTQNTRPKKATTAEQQQKQQKILLVLIILIIAAVVLILYRNGIIGGSSSETPVEQYLQAIAARDFDSFIGSMPPKIAEGYIADRDDIGLSGEEYMYQLYSDYFLEFGDDMTVDVEFTDRSRFETMYVDSFKQSYFELYGEDIPISSAFEIDVTAHFHGSLKSDDIKLECSVIKTGGKWYIAGCEYETVEIDEQ